MNVTPHPRSQILVLQEQIRDGDSDSARAAVTELTRLLRSQGDNAQIRDLLGRAYCVLRDSRRAIENHQRSAELEPDNGTTWFNFAVTLWKLDEATRAVDLMERAMAIEPDSDTAPLYLAQWWFGMGRSEVAEPLIDRAVANHQGKRHLLWQALVKFDRGKVDESQAALAASLRAFVREHFSVWRPSAEEASAAFLRFARGESGETLFENVQQIVAGQRIDTRPLSEYPQILRLRDVAGELQDETTPRADDAAVESAYLAILPFIAASLSTLDEHTWRPARA